MKWIIIASKIKVQIKKKDIIYETLGNIKCLFAHMFQ